MKHLSSILLAAALVAAGTTACFKDPTSDLMNGPVRIDLARSVVFITAGDSVSIQAEVKDDAGNVFSSADATWTSGDETIAVARKDTVYIPGGEFSRVFIRGVAGGQTYARITSNGLTDSVRVVVVPVVFNGTVLPATSNVGDTVTVTATSALTFSTTAGALSDVTVGGREVFILSRTASVIKFIAPKSTTSDTVSISNVLLIGSIRLASLPASSRITVNDPNEPGNDDPATPASLTLYTDKYGSLGGSDVDDFFTFTTTTADSVRIEVLWNNDADIDAYVLNATGGGFCVIDGCSMGTGANPEAKNLRLTAATTYQIYLNLYAEGGTTPVAYRVRITKLQ